MIKLDIDRLKECRERQGFSKIEAARRIHVSQPAYLRYESGQRSPSIQVITEMAKVFQTSVDYLIGNTDLDQPDSLTFSKADQPELFEFVSSYNRMEQLQQQRLLAYLKKFSDS